MIKILLLISLTLSSLFAITGQEIAQKVHDRDEGDNSTAKMKMILSSDQKRLYASVAK